MEIYKISVALAMTSNAPAFLAALSTQLLHVHTRVKDLEGGLTRLSRIKLAVGGGLALAGGVELLKGLKAISDQAKELSHHLATLRTFNLSEGEIGRVQAAARAATVAVPGSTESGNVQLATEAYSMFGLEDTLKIMGPLARFAQATGAITGKFDEANEAMYSMLRSGDLMGKLVDEKTHKVSTDKLLAYLDLAIKAEAASGGKINPQTFLALAQQGGPALAQMSDDGLVSMLMAAQGMGGFRAGTALTSLYQQMIGGTMTQARAKELHRLGLIGDYNVGRGGHLTFPKGSLDTPFAAALQKDPTEAVKILQSAMQAHGINGLNEQTKELFQILGRQTSQRLISDFIRNLPQMLAERARIEGAQGIDAQAATRNDTDYETVEHNLHSAWKNLMQAVAGPNAANSISVMSRLTDALNSMTQSTRDMKPETIQNIATGIGALGVALAGGGGLALLAAIGPTGWLIGGLAALATFGPTLSEMWNKFFNLPTGRRSLDDLDAAREWWNRYLGIQTGRKSLDDLNDVWEWLKAIPARWNAFASQANVAINSAIDSIVSAFVSGIAHMGAAAVSAINSAISGFVTKIAPDGGAPIGDPGGGISPIPQGFHGSTPAPSMIQRANWQPPQRAPQPIYASLKLDLDGRTLAEALSMQIAQLLEHPTSAPYWNGNSRYEAPDSQAVAI